MRRHDTFNDRKHYVFRKIPALRFKALICRVEQRFLEILSYVVIVLLTLRLNYVHSKENILLMNEIGNYEDRKCHLVCDFNFLTASR